MVALFDKYVLRTLALIVAFVLCSASAAAQKKHNFNPAKFEADLEQFIASVVVVSGSLGCGFLGVFGGFLVFLFSVFLICNYNIMV